jgi:hypothetical protein
MVLAFPEKGAPPERLPLLRALDNPRNSWNTYFVFGGDNLPSRL